MHREGIVYRMRCHTCGAGVDNRAAPCVCGDAGYTDTGIRGIVITGHARMHVTSISGAFEHDAQEGSYE